jgi:PAS domain S-box-containing protein
MSQHLPVADIDERARLAAVHRYGILDTPPDGAFDGIAALAAKLFSVPIAIISLVDHDRIWFKAHPGVDVAQIDREPGLCASAIMHEGPWILTDASTDARSLANPLVAGEFGLRFYAGVPLRTPDGHNLGTLCVIDRAPRAVTADEIALLEGLASLVMEQMELRRQARAVVAEMEALAAERDIKAVRLSETERRLSAVLDNASVAIFLMDDKQHCSYMNAAAERLTGYTFEETQGRPLHDVIHHSRPDGSPFPLHECAVNRAFPERRNTRGEEMFVHKDGHFFPVAFTASPIQDEASNTIGTIVEVRDIAARRASEEALGRSMAQLASERHALEVLNQTGAQVAADLDVPSVVKRVVDAGVELTAAQFGAFFYNVEDKQGERMMLYALSGAEIAAFDGFGMPRPTAVFAPTFNGEAIVRSADITQDPRYGHNSPNAGMPPGHLPVRSYLAVPVVSRSGEIIGGLLFGHSAAGVFGERAERLITGLAAQAAIAIDNARLFEAAERAKETLEQRVQERTAELEQAHDALRQSQKMEAVGQLTGGIAHDFNNLLTIVTGNIDMALRALEAAGVTDARARRALGNAMKGADRAASLTQRLLAFSRRQPLAPKPLDVDRLVQGMSDLLHRALGETVRLEIVTSPGLWRAEADPNQLESAILNLAVNARDAMPDGGQLVIETANARLDQQYAAAHAEVAPGQYVVISVSDTGQGMTKETIARVFEPFFTTKEVGKGTGLGLSMVYGFVKQSGGHINIYSEEGQGTSVKIYLPRLLNDANVAEEPHLAAGHEVSRRRETVLVVEDDDDVRAYTVECLRELNYRVLEAHDGPSALRLLERQDEPLDLLFTDVVMPGMSGSELAAAARAMQPRLRVLYTSGYTRNAIVHGGKLGLGVEMIAKPFTYEGLSQKVRDVLDAGWTGRILVVEADQTVRLLTLDALANASFTPEEAGTASEGLAKIRAAQGRYDAVIVDHALPDRSGEAFVAELRSLHIDLPVLITSLGEAHVLSERFARDACTAVLAKPFSGARLAEAIRNLGVTCRGEAA